MKHNKHIYLTFLWSTLFSWNIFFENALAKELNYCPNPPTVVFVQYSFNWPVLKQQKLAKEFALRCGTPSEIEKLAKITEASITQSNIKLVESTLHFSNGAKQPRIILKTGQDDDFTRTAILPIKKLAVDNSYFLSAEIIGDAIEGQELSLKYYIDKSKLVGAKGVIRISWYLGRSLIPNETGKKLFLKEAYAGKTISAVISFVDEKGFPLAKITPKTTSNVRLKPTPPEVKNIDIFGDAIIGRALSVKYQYFDKNPDDYEQGTKIQWLRNGFDIQGATLETYKIVPNDEGTRISVKVIPKSSDGQFGELKIVHMPNKVRDGLIFHLPNLLKQVNGVVVEEDKFTAPTSKPKKFLNIEQEAKKNIQRDYQISNDIYLLPGIVIAGGAPRKFTGLVFSRKEIFDDIFVEQLEGKIIGETISLESINYLSKQLNENFRKLGYVNIYTKIPTQVIDNGKLTVSWERVNYRQNEVLTKFKRNF